MSIQCRWARAMHGERPWGEAAGPAASRSRPGRLVPILLALYLTPALLVVLLVGGVGMLVLAAARAISSIVHGPGPWPRNPIGPGSSTS